ncbi:MAG: formate/nitrite transporter family protein [Bacteroidales bacterium]
MFKNSIFAKACLAGLFIGIAGLIYLSVDNKVIGAILFSFGLLMVVTKGYYLYTGKVGYLLPYTKGYLIILLKTLLGNIVGIGFVGLLFRFAGIQSVIDAAETLSLAKLDHLWYETLILAVFCGMMMYVGVQGYKAMKLDIMKVLIVILAVTIFILSKFEHSIANMLYFFLGNTWSLQAILFTGLWIAGNGIGAVILNLLESHEF